MWEVVQFEKAELESLSTVRGRTNRVSEQLWVMSLIAVRRNGRSTYSRQIAKALEGHGYCMSSETIKERISRFRRSLPAIARSERISLAKFRFLKLCFHFEGFKDAEHEKKYGQQCERIRRQNSSASDGELLQKLKPLLPEVHFLHDRFTNMNDDEFGMLAHLLGIKVKSRVPQLLQPTRVLHRRRVRRA